MAQVTIYLTRELCDQVKAHQLPVSQVCQRALRGELARVKRRRIPATAPDQGPGTNNQEAA